MNINKKPYMGSLMEPSDLTLSDLESYSLGHSDIKVVYLGSEPSSHCYSYTLIGNHIWVFQWYYQA